MKKGPTPCQNRSNVLPLKGEIDLHVSPSVTALLNAMIDNKPQRLMVDLSSVTYIDSSGLAALIAAMQRVEGKVTAGNSCLLDCREPFVSFSRTCGLIR